MRFAILPVRRVQPNPPWWQWTLVSDDGQVHAQGDLCTTPKAAREAAAAWRTLVSLAPIEMAT